VEKPAEELERRAESGKEQHRRKLTRASLMPDNARQCQTGPRVPLLLPPKAPIPGGGRSPPACAGASDRHPVNVGVRERHTS
jgi:hypothetical protein